MYLSQKQNMLLRIEIGNFLSFYNNVVFDMFPNPKREHLQSHILNQKVPLLKQAAVYGENGAGKSNFVMAFVFLKQFIENVNFLSQVDLEQFRFQLSEDKSSAINITIEFSQDGRYYIYQLQINSHITERFYKSGIGQEENTLIFERDGSELKSELVSNMESSKQLLQKNRLSSVLSLNKLFPILSPCEELSDIENWFNSLEIITINSDIPFLIGLLSRNSDIMDFANDVLKNVGITNSLSIKKTSLDEWLTHQNNAEKIKDFIDNNNISESTSLSLSHNNRNEYDFTLDKGSKIVQEFIFEQLGVNGYRKGMSIKSQSDGTVRLLTLIPAFYKAMKQHGVVVIDEIENSMHPNLIYRMVEYFANNKTNGQLIFTTHLTKFQNQQTLMRPDELWMTEKVDGCTQMRSFNDFNIHHTMNIEKGYQEGRYGGVPTITRIATDE